MPLGSHRAPGGRAWLTQFQVADSWWSQYREAHCRSKGATHIKGNDVMRSRQLAVVAIAAGVTVIGAGAAHAVVSKDGTKYCASSQTPATRAYSTGYTEHFPPGGGYASYNLTSWRVTYGSKPSGGGGGFWFVQTTGSLSNSGTYAYCLNGLP